MTGQESKSYRYSTGIQWGLSSGLGSSAMRVDLGFDDRVEFKTISDGTFSLPQHEGVYIYVLYASWPKGDAAYAFKIQVDEPS